MFTNNLYIGYISIYFVEVIRSELFNYMYIYQLCYSY